VSHQAIYRSLFIQARGVLKKELMQHLRSRRLVRRSRHARAVGKSQGLLRQYFPSKTNLSGYSQADLDKVALRLNQQPRKTLGFETPASKLQASVASTG
jgi:IS30 family transposase